MWPLRTRPGWKPPIDLIVLIACAAPIITFGAIYNPKVLTVLAVLTIPMWISLLLIKRGGR